MSSEISNLPPWSNDDALRIGIAEDVVAPRTETIRSDGFDTTINFLCPWNRRFAAYNYIWSHTAPMVGTQSKLFNGADHPVNLMRFNSSVSSDTSPSPTLDNSVDMWKWFWKPIATQIQISAYSEPGAPVNPNRTPHDVIHDDMTLFDGGFVYDNNNECSYVRHTMAKLGVTYKALTKCTQWTVGCTVTPVIEGRQLSPYGYRWGSDGSAIEEDQAPFVMENTLTIDLSYTNCTDLPEWLWYYDGTVNKEDFVLTMGSKFRRPFLGGTLLFIVKSMANKRTYARDEFNDMWDVTLSFNHDRLGFNRFRRMSTLIGTAANAFSDEIVNSLGEPVKNYEEVEWENDFLLDLLLKETS